MEITKTVANEIVTISLDGRLDASTSPELEKELGALIDEGKIKMIIDFTNLGYISSAGLRVLLMIIKKLKALNGNIVLASLKENVKEVFDIAGFSSIFTIVNNLEEANSKF